MKYQNSLWIIILKLSLPKFIFGYACNPLSYRTGVVVHCEIPTTRETTDCRTDKVPIGTLATYNCDNFYVTNDGERKGGSMKCGSNGEWTPELPFRGFSCHVDCGSKSNGLTGTKFPWQAGIYLRHLSTYNYICAGTLISPFNAGFAILTAANCLLENDSTDIKILLGLFTSDFDSSYHSHHSQAFSVKNIFFSSKDENGIALIELKEELTLNDNILPACFSANEDLSKQQLKEGNEAQIVGFDHILKRQREHPVLRNISLKVSPSYFCKNSWRNTICAGNSHHRNEICEGDDGSGLMVSDLFGKQFIQGILPKSSKSCHNYAYFIKTVGFANWIKLVTLKPEIVNSGSASHKVDTIGFPESLVEKPISEEVEIAFQRQTPKPYRPSAPRTTPTYFQPKSTPSHKHETEIHEPTSNFRNYELTGLEWHNIYRRRHNSPEVTLSPKLNQEALSEAERSVANSKYRLQGFANWFGIVGSSLNSTSVVAEAVKDWYRTRSSYDSENPTTLPFTQIVWRNTKEIGVGVASLGNKQVVVVKYNRPLVVEDENIKSFQENVLPPYPK